MPSRCLGGWIATALIVFLHASCVVESGEGEQVVDENPSSREIGTSAPVEVSRVPELEPPTECLLLHERTVSDAICERECEAGQAEACETMANILARRRSRRRALDYALRACELGSPMGCYGAEAMSASLRPSRAQHFPLRVIEPVQRDCDSGQWRACKTLAVRARFLAHDAERSARLETRFRDLAGLACDTGDALACHHLFQALLREGRSPAPDLQQRACDLGHAYSCALMSHGIEGTDRGHALLRRACSGGYTPACSRSRRR